MVWQERGEWWEKGEVSIGDGGDTADGGGCVLVAVVVALVVGLVIVVVVITEVVMGIM